MSQAVIATLFPLPLAPFELYMFKDDRDDYPANFFLRLRFSGRFHRDALQTAAKESLSRHPLLGCVVRETRRDRFEWVEDDFPQPAITWQGDDPSADGVGCRRIDLRNETGLRMFVEEQGNTTDLLLQFHHACCDGLGAMQFVRDLLQSYHAEIAPGEAGPLLPLDPERLRVRSRFGMNLPKYVMRTHKEIIGAMGATGFFAYRPTPLHAGPGTNGDGQSSGFPGLRCHTFSASETATLLATARRLECTLNDLLLCDLFLGLSRWNARYSTNGRRDVLRIMVPTNLRTEGDSVMPAANVVSMAFLDRRAGKISSREALLRGVSWEMNVVKKGRLGLTMIHFLGMLSKCPGGLEKVLLADRCLATSVLSNLGDPTQDVDLPRRDGRLVVGDMVLKRIEAYPPVRPATHATFGITTHAGELTVALHFDRRRFSRHAGDELLGEFLRQIRTSLVDGGERG